MNNSAKSELMTLHADLKALLARTRAQTARTSILLVVLVLAIAGYWMYLYTQTAKINAESAADYAYLRTLEYVRAAPPTVSQALNDRAPEVYDYMEAQILAAPAAISDNIQQAAVQQTQHVLDQSTPRISQVISDAVAQAKAATGKAGFDGKDPAQLDKMIAVVTDKTRAGLSEGLEKLYGEYDLKAKEAVSYLETMAAGKNLDRRQQHLRDVIVSFLAVAEKQKQLK